MSWLLEIYAAVQAGFGFLARNYAECSSTQILQATLIVVGVVGLLRILLRGLAGERMRRRLHPIDLGREPALAGAIWNARRMANFRRRIDCYWAGENCVQLATLGYLSPSLIIGPAVTDALSAGELEAALAHELSHARRRDALRLEAWQILFALGVLSSAFATLLFLVFYAGAFRIDQSLALATAAVGLGVAVAGSRMSAAWFERNTELACDGAAAAGPGGPLTAAAALVKVARLERGALRTVPAAALPLFSADTFQLRVNSLMRQAPRPDSRRFRVDGWRVAGWAALALSAAAIALPIDMKQAAAEGCSTCALVVKKSANWTA